MKVTILNVHVEGASVSEVTQCVYETFATVWDNPEDYILRQITIEPDLESPTQGWTARATALDKDAFDAMQNSMEIEFESA